MARIPKALHAGGKNHQSLCRYLWAVFLSAACASVTPEPILPALRDSLSKSTVILVPGVSGTKLRDRVTGNYAWGTTKSFFAPRDGGYATALPISNQTENRLEPAGPIEEIRLLSYRKEVYGTVLRLLEANGFRRGERFFVFDYDWREDNVTAARKLATRIQRLAESGKHEKFTLICQSNAAQICRYAFRYGDVSLEEAESGRRRLPGPVSKVIFVGTSHGGAIRILRELDRGRRYIPIVGRRWLPEVIFTFRSLFFDLPVYSESFFVDERGRPLNIDLFDAESWRRYEWSIYSPEASRRVAKGHDTDLYSTEDERLEYLRKQLADARRMHQLLQRSERVPLPNIYSIQSLSFETPERAVVLNRDGHWRTLFANDRSLSRDPSLRTITTSAGDYHATGASQHWLSDDEKAALTHLPFYFEARHFELITHPDAQRKILEFLSE